jgi:hypothetical protein
MNPPGGNTLDWDGDSKSGAVMQLTMKVAKLETFVRQLEKDVETGENSRERLSKIETQLETLKSRLCRMEDSLDELDDLKSAAKWLSPKTLGGIIALLLGGSVAGNATIDAVTETPQEDKIEKLLKALETEND